MSQICEAVIGVYQKRSRRARVGVGGTVTYPDLLIFRTCSKIFAIWAEAHAPDVQVPGFARRLVHQHACSISDEDSETYEKTNQVFWPVFVS